MIVSVCASPLTSVPVMVTVLPLSLVPAVVQVIILPATKVATSPLASVPSIVKSVFGRAAAATDAASTAFVSAVIKTAFTSEPASVYSSISPRKIKALRSALPTGGSAPLLTVFAFYFGPGAV